MSISPAALALTSLSLEYSKIVASAAESDPKTFLREILRYLPRLYTTIIDIRPYETETEPEETGVIYDTVTEDQYEDARMAMTRVLGEYDMYLDTPAEQMQYSDTPVAVSLSEQLADIFQATADFASTMAQITPDMVPDAVSEMKYRFNSYLSGTICRALAAANYIYFNASFDQ